MIDVIYCLKCRKVLKEVIAQKICPACRTELSQLCEEVVTLSHPKIKTVATPKGKQIDARIYHSETMNPDVLSCEEALLYNDKNVAALSHLAKYYKSIGHLDRAVVYLQKLIQIEDHNLEWHEHMADIYLAQENSPLALKEMKKIAKETRNKGHVYFNIGLIYLKDDQIDKATEYFHWVEKEAEDETLISRAIAILQSIKQP